MKILKIARTLPIAAALAMLFATSAFAQEARPWLCRDKPVFSYDRSMEYKVSARPGRQWRMFFMQYSPDAAHDGFDIVNSREVASRGEVGEDEVHRDQIDHDLDVFLRVAESLHDRSRRLRPDL